MHTLSYMENVLKNQWAKNLDYSFITCVKWNNLLLNVTYRSKTKNY